MRLFLTISLAAFVCVAASGASCPSGSTQRTSSISGGSVSNPSTWAEGSVGTGDGMCLLIRGPVVIDQDLGTSGGVGVYTIIQSGSGTLSVNTSASRHIYFASTGADPVGSGTVTAPGVDASMYGFYFPAGTLSLAGTQANPVVINSADGADPWYISGNAAGTSRLSVAVKWCDCLNLGTNVAGFYGIDIDASSFIGSETFDIENSRFTNPYQVLYMFPACPGSDCVTVMNNVITGRQGPTTLWSLGLISPVIVGNTESAPAQPGWFAQFLSVGGSSTAYSQNTIAGTSSIAVGNLTLASAGGNGAIQNNLTWNDPAQAGSFFASVLSISQSAVFTGVVDSNFCENCNQTFAVHGSSPAAALSITNNFAVTNHLAQQGQGIYFISGASVFLSGNIGIFADASVPGPEQCIFGYSPATSLIATNNTCHAVAGPGSFSFGIAVGEPGHPATSGQVAANLVSGYQRGIVDGDPGNSYTPVYIGTGVYQNDVWNATKPYISDGSPGFDNGVQAHPSALYGDLTIDPGYHDATRLSLALYDSAVLGGPGTPDDVITQIGYRSGWGGTNQLGSNPVNDIVTWFRAGFTPSNPAVCPGGITPGAMPCIGTTLTMSISALPDATQGSSYSQSFSVVGGSNCAFTAAGTLPSGLVLRFTQASDTASIAGTPTATGTYTFVISGVCSNGAATAPLTITVDPAPPLQIDVSGLVQVTGGGLVFNRVTNIYSGSVNIISTSYSPVPGPLLAVFYNLPAGVTVANQSGILSAGPYVGSPYITVPVVPALATRSFVTVNVEFLDPSHVAVSYVPRVLSIGYGAGVSR